MAYKEGDRITFKDYDLKRDGDTVVVCDVRQIPTFYEGKYVIDLDGLYTPREGVIRGIWSNSKDLGYNWDGEAYVIHCDGDVSDDGIGFDYVIPSEWIII